MFDNICVAEVGDILTIALLFRCEAAVVSHVADLVQKLDKNGVRGVRGTSTWGLWPCAATS